MLALQELTILMRLNWQSGRWPSKVVDIWSHRETFEFKDTFMWIHFYRFIENVWYILWQVARRCQIKKWRSLRKCFPRWDGAECFSNVNTLKIKGRGRGGDFKLSPKAWRHFKIFTISHPKMVMMTKLTIMSFPRSFIDLFVVKESSSHSSYVNFQEVNKQHIETAFVWILISGSNVIDVSPDPTGIRNIHKNEFWRYSWYNIRRLK